MIRRSIVAGIAVAVLVALPAIAAVIPRGAGPTAQALMLAATVGSDASPVQVLNQLCDNPTRIRRCEPIRPVLQRALDDAIAAPITWVTKRTPHLGEFWVLAPVRFDAQTVTSEYAWWEPGPYGCAGWTQLRWARDHGVWTETGGVGVVGCPARPV